MSYFQELTIEVDPCRLNDFFEVQEKYLIPLHKSLGNKLQGIYLEVCGAMKPAIVTDVWEIESIEAAVKIMESGDFATDERWLRYAAVAKEVIYSEKTRFIKRIFGPED